MDGKLGPFSRFLGKVSGLLVAGSTIYMMIKGDVLSGATLGLVLLVVWVFFVRVLIFVSSSGDLDVTPLQDELLSEEEEAAMASFQRLGTWANLPAPGEVVPEPNPQRIMGADNRTLVGCAHSARPTRQSRRREPDPEAEDDRAFAEMMRVL